MEQLCYIFYHEDTGEIIDLYVTVGEFIIPGYENLSYITMNAEDYYQLLSGYDYQPNQNQLKVIDGVLVVSKSGVENYADLQRKVSETIDQFLLAHSWDNMAVVLAQKGEFALDSEIAQGNYDNIWSKCFELQADVLSGAITYEQAKAQLPTLTWDA